MHKDVFVRSFEQSFRQCKKFVVKFAEQIEIGLPSAFAKS